MLVKGPPRSIVHGYHTLGTNCDSQVVAVCMKFGLRTPSSPSIDANIAGGVTRARHRSSRVHNETQAVDHLVVLLEAKTRRLMVETQTHPKAIFIARPGLSTGLSSAE